MKITAPGCKRDRPSDECRCLAFFSLLMADDAQEMKCVCVTRVRSQDRLIKPSRHAQVACLMKPGRPGEFIA
jgi:hypothetical protein